jgi:hypothetical protein
MALRDSKVFLVFAWGLVALALASFALRVILKVSAGDGGATYRSGTGLSWHYSSALVVIVAVGIILFAGFLGWVWRRVRRSKPDNEA